MSYNHKTPVAGNAIVAPTASHSMTSHNLDRDGFLPARAVLDRYRVSQMTIWRWLQDEQMGFPKPVYLGRFRYWRISEIETWEAAQAAKGGVQ